jgi:hypothetical protein
LISLLKCDPFFQAQDFLIHGGVAGDDAAGEGGIRFEESYLALTEQTLFLFNCDDSKILNYKKKDLSQLAEVKHRPDKKQCILVSVNFIVRVVKFYCK